MSAYTIRCVLCGHVFDHDPKFSKHCKCKSCRASISIPDSRREYIRYSTPMAAAQPAAKPPIWTDPDALPPAVRDKDGQPIKAVRDVRTPDKPRYACEDYSFIKRRAEQLAKEKAERVAEAPIEDTAASDKGVMWANSWQAASGSKFYGSNRYSTKVAAESAAMAAERWRKYPTFTWLGAEQAE